jgi:hypothetical protein
VTDTQSESESNGETGSEGYSSSEGPTSLSWSETAAYALNSSSQYTDQGTETDGESDSDPDGGGAGHDGESYSSSSSDDDGSSVTTSLNVAGAQSINSGYLVSATPSFTWYQRLYSDTDTYSTTVGNLTELTSYLLGLTDTVSSSWHDAGDEDLTTGDAIVGETNTYSWDDLNSVTDTLMASNTDSNSVSYSSQTYAAEGTDSYSLNDTGTETLSAEEGDPGSWSVVGATDDFAIQNSDENETDASATWSDEYDVIDGDGLGPPTIYTVSFTGAGLAGLADTYSMEDVGDDSIAGSTSDSSDSYTLDDWESASDANDYAVSAFGTTWDYYTYNGSDSDPAFYTLAAGGTDSVGADGDDQSTYTVSTDSWFEESGGASYSLPIGVLGSNAGITWLADQNTYSALLLTRQSRNQKG